MTVIIAMKFLLYFLLLVSKLVFCWKLSPEGFSGDTIKADLRRDKFVSIK